MMSRRVRQHLAVGAFLVAVWVVLWGEVSAVNVLSGAAVAAFVLALSRLQPPQHRVHPLGIARYIGDLLVRVFRSTVEVIRVVFSSGVATESVTEVELGPTTPLVSTMVANMITLTPGTTVAEDPGGGELTVHSLGSDDAAGLRSDVADMQGVATDALTPFGTHSS